MMTLNVFQIKTVIKLTLLELKSFWKYVWKLDKKFSKNIVFTSHDEAINGFSMFRVEQIYECLGDCGISFSEALNVARKEVNSSVAVEFFGQALRILDGYSLAKFYDNPYLFPDPWFYGY